MEPGTKVEIHHHPVDEMLIVICGAIRAILVDDDKNVIDAKVIRPADGIYGVQLPKNIWHTIECLEPDTCMFEVKEGKLEDEKVKEFEGVMSLRRMEEHTGRRKKKD